MTAEPGCCPSACICQRCIDRLFTPAVLPGAGWVATQPSRSRCLRGPITAQVSKHLAAGQGLERSDNSTGEQLAAGQGLERSDNSTGECLAAGQGLLKEWGGMFYPVPPCHDTMLRCPAFAKGRL